MQDDMEIAPDFFQYFFAMLPVLRSDPTLWTVRCDGAECACVGLVVRCPY